MGPALSDPPPRALIERVCGTATGPPCAMRIVTLLGETVNVWAYRIEHPKGEKRGTPLRSRIFVGGSIAVKRPLHSACVLKGIEAWRA